MSNGPGLLDVEEALARLIATLPEAPREAVRIAEAIGRALAAPVSARRTLPPWDNSAMDGYAVRADDVALGARLRVEEILYAGATPARTVTAGTCARIMTGAPLPPGADAVVMQEHTRAHEGGGAHGSVELLEASAQPGQFVRPRGEDAVEGTALLPAGTPIGLPEAALLWAQGLETVTVPRRPRVAILSTGDELCDLSDPRPDRLIDTNSLMLEAAVLRTGGLPTRLGIAPDRLEAVEALLRKALGYDLVLTSAGVSVGERDFVREATARLGVQSEFWRVALKPGKPLAVGRRDQTVFIGLPGNPTSSLVTFELFVRPALLRWLGHRELAPTVIPARVGAPYKKAPGLVHFVRVTARWEEGQLVARPLASQTSGALRSAVTATHLMRLPKAMGSVSPGDSVELLPVSWAAL